MPLPLAPLVWAGAAALGALGLKKGVDAKKTFSEPEEIGRKSERKYRQARYRLEKCRQAVNGELEDLGRFRAEVFTNEIAHMVSMVNRYKKAKGKLEGFDPELELRVRKVDEYQAEVNQALELQRGLASGLGSGALTALGAYGGVGALASASTGTAIATLSGAAAKNATLAWLGGGALSTCGFGMVGGMVTLGGVAAGPALAITGFTLAAKAEEQLTKAREYRADVEVACKKIEALEVGLSGLSARVAELTDVTKRLRAAYNAHRVDEPTKDQLELLLAIGMNLKGALTLPVMEKDGSAPEGFSVKCQGLLETRGLVDNA